MRTSLLTFGEPAPWFIARCTADPEFHFDTVAGRYVVLCFFGSAEHANAHQALSDFWSLRAVFYDVNATFFGVSNDADDERLQRVRENLPGIRYLWDFDRSVAQLYGACPDGGPNVEAHTLVLDERLRTLAAWPLDGRPTHAAQVVNFLRRCPPIGSPGVASAQAPVLVVPRVFASQLCQTLIAYYDRHGGEESGFMRDKDGRTVAASDPSFKRRRDQDIADESLRKACMVRIHDRLAPEIAKAFQFRATRIERYIVACYEGSDQGFFRAHRDNTTKGTAHRRFAVTLNLNTGDYDGGFLRFPEFGPKHFSAPRGGGVVFSCALLHEATPVTRGRRYAFLPFLYDDAAAEVRRQNEAFVDIDDPAGTKGRQI